jgi:hypothetical protein
MGLFRRLVFRPLSLINQRRLGWLQFIFRVNRKQASPLVLVHHRPDHIFRRERIIFGGERSPRALPTPNWKERQSLPEVSQCAQ